MIGDEPPNPPLTIPPGALSRILANCQLTTLDVAHWNISESDVAAIGRQQKLGSLDLSCTNLSEEGLAKTITLPALESFSFIDCSSNT